jgi:predicted dehydrogenase
MVGSRTSDRLQHTFVHQVADFIEGLDAKGERAIRPDFRDALETQFICDAVLASAKSGKWESIEKR